MLLFRERSVTLTINRDDEKLERVVLSVHTAVGSLLQIKSFAPPCTLLQSLLPTPKGPTGSIASMGPGRITSSGELNLGVDGVYSATI